MNLYKNTKVLKKDMTKEELDEILGEMDLCDLFDDMNINETQEKQEVKEDKDEELDGID